MKLLNLINLAEIYYLLSKAGMLESYYANLARQSLGTTPNPKYPGNDITKPPAPGFEWRGSGDPASGKGSWYNPTTGESYHPDLNHPIHGDHWDYIDSDKNSWRIYPNGEIERKY